MTISGLTLTKGNAGSGDGGAVVAGSHLTLDGVVVSDSRAGEGGGIFASNALTVRNSTVSGNTSENFGGGIN
jgi:hypothetical protein